MKSLFASQTFWGAAIGLALSIWNALGHTAPLTASDQVVLSNMLGSTGATLTTGGLTPQALIGILGAFGAFAYTAYGRLTATQQVTLSVPAVNPPKPLTKGLLFLALASTIYLSACANLKDPTTAIVSAESGYAAALAVENAYLASGKASPAIVAKLAQARKTVAATLDPLAAAAAAGQAPSSDQTLAVQTALAAYQAVITNYNLNAVTVAAPTGSK